MNRAQKNSIQITSGLLVVMLGFQNCSDKKFQSASLLDGKAINRTDNSAAVIPELILKSNPLSLTNVDQVSFIMDLKVDQQSKKNTIQCNLEQNGSMISTSDCSSATKQYIGLTDGDYTFSAVGKDAFLQSSNIIRYIFRLDRIAPVLTVTEQPALVSSDLAPKFIFTVKDNFSTAAQITTMCSLDNAVFAKCSSGFQITDGKTGSRNIRIYARDQVGNQSATYTYTWTINSAAPTLNFTSTVNQYYNTKTISISFNGTVSGAAVTQFQCSLNSSTFSNCTSPYSTTAATEGANSFQFRAVLSGGSFSAAKSVSWIVDTIKPSAPVVTSDVGATTNLTTARFSFSSNDGAQGSGVSGYLCALNSSTFSNCTSAQAVTLSVGANNFQVKSVDQAGNESTVASFQVQVNQTTPVWNVSSIAFIIGALPIFDLKATLPVGVKTGGVFGVDSAGTQLPASTGILLSTDGVLTLVAGVQPVQLDGVIFTYTEP